MYKKIIVPIDGSYTSSLALDEAIKLGKSLNSIIDVVHVAHTLDNLELPDNIDRSASANAYAAWVNAGKSVLDYAKNQLNAAHLQGNMMLIENLSKREDIGFAILETAHKLQAELIIIGAHGLSGIKEHTLGRVAQQLINQGDVPVWLIRGNKEAQSQPITAAH
jgi:nucleotide-binding universal stress UspA family protein